MDITLFEQKKVAQAGTFDKITKTRNGKDRAFVPFDLFRTLWFNTGTLCNIACENCYIFSSPINDSLSYLTRDDVKIFLDQLQSVEERNCEIGFTGGEPFMNPHFMDILRDVLSLGHDALVLSNAMQPMQRPRIKSNLVELERDFPGQITLRVSLDHFTAEKHDIERGVGSFEKTVAGLCWLNQQKMTIHIAGRRLWDEDEDKAREGYRQFVKNYRLNIDVDDCSQLILFPEMDENVATPEITTECWDITGVRPETLMCASSRMVVKKKGKAKPQIQACTLIPFLEEFNFGASLDEARQSTYLNHPHCSKFCVLGGGKCSA